MVPPIETEGECENSRKNARIFAQEKVCVAAYVLYKLNLKYMWYNKIVMDNDNVLSKEKYYVNESEMWEIVEECGIDIMGCMVCEFWSKD